MRGRGFTLVALARNDVDFNPKKSSFPLHVTYEYMSTLALGKVYCSTAHRQLFRWPVRVGRCPRTYLPNMDGFVVYEWALRPALYPFFYMSMCVLCRLCIFLQRLGVNVLTISSCYDVTVNKSHLWKKETTWISDIKTRRTRSVDSKLPRPRIVWDN